MTALSRTPLEDIDDEKEKMVMLMMMMMMVMPMMMMMMMVMVMVTLMVNVMMMTTFMIASDNVKRLAKQGSKCYRLIHNGVLQPGSVSRFT